MLGLILDKHLDRDINILNFSIHSTDGANEDAASRQRLMYDKSWGTDALVLSSRLRNFGPLKWGSSAMEGRIWGEGYVIFNGLLAQLVGCWMCFLEVVGWIPTWPVSGGTTAARRERVQEELLRFSHEVFPQYMVYGSW